MDRDNLVEGQEIVIADIWKSPETEWTWTYERPGTAFTAAERGVNMEIIDSL